MDTSRTGALRLIALPVVRLAALTLIAFVAALAAARPAPPAEAAFHFAVIDEVMFGKGGDANLQYVEIKMESSGQLIVGNTRLSAWNADGTFFGVLLLVPSNVSMGVPNTRWVMATPAFAAAAGITPDFTFAPAALPSTGMVCWGAPGVVPPAPGSWDPSLPANYVDCVPYGGYAAANIRFGPATALGLGDGSQQSLTRVTHTDNTSADFALSCPTPQANKGAVGFNHDNHIDLPPTLAFDDLTWANSDLVGDDCGDADDDNDGLPDANEAALPGAACPSASAATDSRKADSDGDLTLDGAECALGFDPANAASVPGTITPDTDNDRLPDALEAGLGAVVGDADSDDDKIIDGIEFRFYNSSPSNANTDGDLCRDGKEIASINADTTVSSIDLGQIAQHFSDKGQPPYISTMDVNKDAKISSIDLSQVAQQFGSCP
jgi:hypothetical protein